MTDGENTLHISPFDALRHIDGAGNEYWSARDLAQVLDYSQWRNFKYALNKAKVACQKSGADPADHFAASSKMVGLGSGGQREVEDYHISRYGCYLLIQNADPEKEIVALGQTYFTVQTRRQELADEEVLAGLTENQRRLLVRGQLTLHNRQLAETASYAGVISTKDFAIFQDHGYVGLYGGLKARDIHARKGLKSRQKILDYMGSTELAANLFRATQTEEQIRREGIKEKGQANAAHYTMGKRVRQFIKDGGGTLPEDLPVPEKSIQQLQREEQKRLEQGQQPSLFDQLPDV